MSIFTVIKYPLAEHPTPEQVMALPDDLLNQWFHHPSLVRTWFHVSASNHNNIALLRKLMQEYQE